MNSVMPRVLAPLRVPLLLALVLLALVPLSGCAAPRPSAATYASAAVAADHIDASDAGLEMLKQGGNAVDAAVATSFALSVVRPYSCGIGGGGFMVIHFSDAGLEAQRARGRETPRTVALNYREQSPKAATPALYASRNDPAASTEGGAAVAIPGTVAGLLHALERYGTLDRAAVLAPAIRLAERGFTVDDHYVASVRGGPDRLVERFERTPALRERFAFVWDRFLKQGRVKRGDRIVLPEQAAALRLIARDGASAMTTGPIGAAILRATEADGGVMTATDLASFRVATVEPLRFTAWGRTFVTMPPPSSGGITMGQTLALFERNYLRAQGAAANLQVDASPARALGEGTLNAFDALTLQGRRRWKVWETHLLAESLKHAFADRSRWLGDPAFVDVPVERLLSTKYLDDRAKVFDPEGVFAARKYGTEPPASAPRAAIDDAGTSHLSVVDAQGNAVACTETINLAFGSLLAVPEFGFVLNNEMDDFTTRVGQPNAFGLLQSEQNAPAWRDDTGGSRPLSSMTPTIVLDESGRVEAVAGASGGPRIITGTTQVLINALVHKDRAAEAVARPRVHHQWSPLVLSLEPWSDRTRLQEILFEDAFKKDLEARGHRVERIASVGDVQLILRDPNGKGWQAASDPRKGGRPAGY